MKVFLDTNVLLDFFLHREGFDASQRILLKSYRHECDFLVSSLSYSNIAYIARKKFRGNEIYDVLDVVREMASVSSVHEEIVDQALRLRAKDFEDALQYYSALSVGADVIVTNNVKDFPFSAIPVLTPDQFLETPRK